MGNGRRRAIVVDPDFPAARAAAALLAELGYDAEPFMRTDRALLAAAAQRPQLALLELELSDLDGPTFLQLLHTSVGLASCQAIGCSAHQAPSGPVARLFRAAGGLGVLTKPLSLRALRDVLAPPGEPAEAADEPSGMPGDWHRAFQASTPDWADELANSVLDDEQPVVGRIRPKAPPKVRRPRDPRLASGAWRKPSAPTRRSSGGDRRPRASSPGEGRVWTAPGAEVTDGPTLRTTIEPVTGRKRRRKKGFDLSTAAFSGFAGKDELPVLIRWPGGTGQAILDRATPTDLALRVLGPAPALDDHLQVAARFIAPGEKAASKLKLVGVASWVEPMGEHHRVLMRLETIADPALFEKMLRLVKS